MEITRRQAIVLTAAAGLTPIAGSVRRATADVAEKRHSLYGRWHVECPAGHVTVVTAGTKQHECDYKVDGKICGKQCFVAGKVTVMCPVGHANVVDVTNVDYVESLACAWKNNDGKECGKKCEGW